MEIYHISWHIRAQLLTLSSVGKQRVGQKLHKYLEEFITSSYLKHSELPVVNEQSDRNFVFIFFS